MFSLVGALLVAACSGASPTTSPSDVSPATSSPAPSTTAQDSAALGTFSPALLPAPEISELKFAVDAVEANTFVPRLALDAGLYEKYGLTVEVLPLAGEQETLAAMIAGQVQVALATPRATMISMTTEQPVQDVGVYANHFLDCYVTTPDITDAASLKGKRMAVSNLSGQSHAQTILVLKELGMTDKDVQIVQVGGQGDRVAALQAGSVDVVPADCVTAQTLVDEGFSIFMRLPDLNIEAPNGNIQFLRSFIAENPGTVLAVTAANLEAIQLLFTNEDFVVKAFAPWGQVSEEEARALIADFRGIAQRDLRSTLEAYNNLRDIIVTQGSEEVANLDLTQAFTWQFLDQLQALGLNEQLGIPGG
jgi:NitT/TauT family transport system substrate-binding protein